VGKPRTKKTETDADFFKKTDDFIKAFELVLKKGYFISMAGRAEEYDPNYFQGRISALGLIPDNKKNKKNGITAFLNPMVMIQGIHTRVEAGLKIIHWECRVKMNDCTKNSDSKEKFGVIYDFDLNIFLAREVS
jgi:hypothetical protein